MKSITVIETFVLESAIWVNCDTPEGDKGIYLKRNSDSENIRAGDEIKHDAEEMYYVLWNSRNNSKKDVRIDRMSYLGAPPPPVEYDEILLAEEISF